MVDKRQLVVIYGGGKLKLCLKRWMVPITGIRVQYQRLYLGCEVDNGNGLGQIPYCSGWPNGQGIDTTYLADDARSLEDYGIRHNVRLVLRDMRL